MKKNNVDKRMPSKGGEAVRKELIKLAGDYKDPAEIEMDITQELIETLREQFKEMQKEGYSGSFIDFIKSDIDLKRKTLIPISGIFGFFCTLWYNGITTLSYPISAGFSFDEALAYSVSGILFTLMHLFSNTLIFTVVVPGYIYRIKE